MDCSGYEKILELMKSRRSIRQFEARPVGREQILQVLEAGRWAPSNHNRQPWRFIVLENRQQISSLAECVRAHLVEKLKVLPKIASEYASELLHYATFFGQVPALIVVLHKLPINASAPLLKDSSNPSLISGEALSVAMAVQNMLLAAHSLGLGACVLTGPLLVTEAVASQIELPAGMELNCLVALGHPDETPDPPRRKSLEQIVEFREG